MLDRIKNFLKKWWIILIIGIISVILGILMIANPGKGFNFARIIVLIDYLAIGITGVATTIARRDEIPAWGWNLVGSILILLMGIIVAVVPGMSQTLLLIMFITGFILQGISGIFAAIALKKAGTPNWGWSLAFAILTVIVGIMLMINPLVAALSIGILVAVEMFSFGISMILLSIRLSKIKGAIDRL